MEQQALKIVEQTALKKYKSFCMSKDRYLARAILAGMFIGVGVIVSFKTANFFYLEHSPMAYPLAALIFSVAIIMIAYAGGDLFTGNTFYFAYASMKKTMKWTKTFKLWLFTYTGNLIGALIFALMILLTGLFTEPSSNEFLFSIVSKKMHVPTMELFFRGILCNWLVCLAFFVPMSIKNEAAKLFLMILFVFSFFVSGYEHSIANMASFIIALFLEHPDTITFAGMLHNLVPVTLGNIVGGSVMTAAMYFYANKPYMEQTEAISTPHTHSEPVSMEKVIPLQTMESIQ
jgi:nitrite transporter